MRRAPWRRGAGLGSKEHGGYSGKGIAGAIGTEAQPHVSTLHPKRTGGHTVGVVGV